MQSNDTRPLCRCGCGVPAHSDTGFARGQRPCQGTPEQRFWARVEKTDTCWLWAGIIGTSSGYGRFFLSGPRPVRAHRYAWTMATGEPIPDSLDVLHTCDVRRCIRHDDEGVYVVAGITYRRFGHLWLGDHDANMADRREKGRSSRSGAGENQAVGGRIATAKLTDDEVRRIRGLAEVGLSSREIGSIFSVSYKSVLRIVSGTGWTHVEGVDSEGATTVAASIIEARTPRTGPGDAQARGTGIGNAKLTEDDTRVIRRLSADGWTHRAIAAALNVQHPTIGRILRGNGWKHVD